MTMEPATLPALSAPSVRAGSEPILSHKAILLDVVERIVFLVMFGRFAFFVLQNLFNAPSIEVLLLLISETLPVIFIILRKPTTTLSDRPLDWFFGFAGSLAPLLVTPAAVHPLLHPMICVALVIAGFFIQIAAKIVLGRSFGIVAANRGIKIAGPYRFIRHPMYAGYTTTHIGLLLTMPSLFNALFYATALMFQIIRILREEHVLMQSSEYRDFATRVRYRLLPGVF